MSDDFSALENFSGRARLFPLPNVVFYPMVMLPLHIFEPRYRQMTADALAGDRLITMVLLRPGWEADYEGKPAVSPVGCIGKIIAEQELEDGRYNILLRGLARVRLLNEVEDEHLYRTAQVRLLHEFAPPESPQVGELRRRLVERVPVWLPAPGPRSQLQKLLDTDLPLGALCDILGFALPLELGFKQELLEQLNAEERATMLLRYLESVTPPEAKGAPGRFPPEFSTN
jgi:Lon protease-like protein